MMLPNWIETLIGISLGILIMVGSLALYGHIRQPSAETQTTAPHSQAELAPAEVSPTPLEDASKND